MAPSNIIYGEREKKNKKITSSSELCIIIIVVAHHVLYIYVKILIHFISISLTGRDMSLWEGDSDKYDDDSKSFLDWNTF